MNDTSHNALSIMAEAARLRQVAFSAIAQLSLYPSSDKSADLRRLVDRDLPFLAQALGDDALMASCETFSEHFDNHAFRARVEWTRVFYTEHTLHPFASRYLGPGEPAALAEIIHSLGLKPASEPELRADHISCQADLLAYCSDMESEAWRNMDAIDAMEWRRTGASVWFEHSEEFFSEIAHDIAVVSPCQYFKLWSRLIARVAESSPYEIA